MPGKPRWGYPDQEFGYRIADDGSVEIFSLNGTVSLTILTDGTVEGSLHQFKNAADPTDPQDLVTMAWALTHGGGGGGSGNSRTISQAAHGLMVSNVVRFDGTDYVTALADSAADAEVVGIVTAVADANTFTLTMGGYVTGLTGLSDGAVHFLDPSTPGLLTTVQPTAIGQVSKPLLIADSFSSGYLFNFRGEILTPSQFGNLDGGAPNSIYLDSQFIDGGTP